MHVRHSIFAVLLAGVSAAAGADSPVPEPTAEATRTVVADVDTEAPVTGDDEFDYDAHRIALFDRVSNDSSPRQQVLAGEIYLEDDDTTLTLRPKRKDVVARAVQLAPDDAFVQYVAAMQGSYSSSQCGPTTYPEAEVANLVRLEPDNAAAWPFAVALAHVRGDHAGVDEALSRMASATRADDHRVEHLAEWRKALAGPLAEPPFIGSLWPQASAADRTLLSAFAQIDSSGSAAAAVLTSACTSDAGERTWQRLGWCADAGRVLAGKGGSLALRKQGLTLLEAIGDRSAETADVRRQADWLAAHDAHPLRSFGAESSPDRVISDWANAKTEIDAIEHKLRRTGQPLRAPPTWSKPIDLDDDDAAREATQKALRDYLESLVASMRASGNERAQAVVATAQGIIAEFGADEAAPVDEASLGELARVHTDSVLVQWLAATAGATADIPFALANLQRVDAENAAAWLPALMRSIEAGDATSALLEQMASRARFDDHLVDIVGVWGDAIRAHPPSAEALSAMATLKADAGLTAETAMSAWALMMAYSSMPAYQSIFKACSGPFAEADAQRSDCVQIARVMLHSSTTVIAARIGEGVLRKLDAMTAADTLRARKLAWWSSLAGGIERKDGQATVTFFNDQRATGSEIDALRLGAERLGKAEPGETWRSPTDKRATANSAKPVD